MRRDVGLDPADRLVQGRRPDQVAADHRHTGEGWMGVRVLEPRQQCAPVQVDALGDRPPEAGERGVGRCADRGDRAVSDGDGGRWPAVSRGRADHAPAAGVGSVDRAAFEDHIRVCGHALSLLVSDNPAGMPPA